MLQVGVVVLGRGHIGHILKVLDFLKTFTKFVCLLGIFFHSRILHSYGDVTIVSKRLHIFTYAQHSWPLSSEGSLACHT